VSETELDPVFRALADPTRRAVLDLLREGPRSTGTLCAAFPRLSRFAVVKHLAVLRDAGLVAARAAGRMRWNRLEPALLRAVYDRWLRAFEVSAALAVRSRPSLEVEAPDSRVRSPGAAHRPMRREGGAEKPPRPPRRPREG